ncbi:MAG: ABC transporter permease [Anaerolineales bacterium]|nr:ABC transporter permease [Anaerolineales bacterium]
MPHTSAASSSRTTASRLTSSRAWKKFLRHTPALFGLTLILLLALTALLAPVIAPYEYDAQDLTKIRQPPSVAHPFGTDKYGRDVFSRVVYGARIALQVAFVVVGIELLVGVTLGMLAGYFRGWVDSLISGLIDLVWAFPPLILALGIIAAIGSGLVNVMIAIALTSWAPFARVTRAKVLSMKEREFVEAGIAIGESDWSILTHYLLPTVIAPNLVLATLTIPAAILTTSALSFLGLGAQPPSPDWGAILNEGREFLRDAWWISTFPGLAILLTALAFNFLGDGLRDVLDPKQTV